MQAAERADPRVHRGSWGVIIDGMWLSRDQLAAMAETLDLVEHEGAGALDAPASGPPRIPGFDIEEVVGQGGMGTVYRAVQEQPRRTVALKVIDPRRVSRRTLRWFAQEARALGRLEHPSIARIYEAGTFEDGDQAWPYIAMEFAPGTPLSDPECRALSRRQRVEIIESLADAVQHAHTRGVIHRDLKPGNVIVDSSTMPIRARIVDFGVAQITEADWQLMTLHTEAAPVVGTLPYMSPEQVAGDPRDIDARADVYALGVMLYELLVGALPHRFQNRNLSEMARIIRDESPADVRQVDPTVPRDLATITMKAIARDAGDRYDSARDLANDLERFRSRLPITARPPSAWYRASRFVQRNAVLVGAGSVVFAVLLTATIGMALALKNAQAANRRAMDVFDGVVAPLQELAEYGGGNTLRAEALPILSPYADRLLDAMPDDHRVHQLRGRVRLGEAELAYDRRDLAEARAGFDAVFRDLLPLIETPDAAPSLCDLTVLALVRRGDCEGAAGDLTAALATYERAFKMEQDFVERFPDLWTFQDDLIWGHERVGMMNARVGNLERAKELVLERRRLAIAHLDADPDDTGRQFGVMCAHLSLGQFELRHGDADRARDALRAARDAGRAFIEHTPDRVAYRRRFAGVLANLASLMDSPAEAEPLYREIVAERAAITQLEPLNLEFGSQYGAAARRLARCRAKLGQHEGGFAVATQAIERLRLLWQLSEPNRDLATTLESLLYLRAEIRRTLGRSLRVGETSEHEEVLEIYAALCASVNAHATSFARLAHCHMLLEQDDAAQQTIDELVLHQSLDELSPSERALVELTRTILAHRAAPSAATEAAIVSAATPAKVPSWYTPRERAMFPVEVTGSTEASGASRSH